MALTGSGQLSLGDIAGEFGGSAPHAMSEYYDGGLGPSAAPSSGEIKISDFHGTSANTATDFTNTFSTSRSPATYVVGDTFTITNTGIHTFNNLNLDQVDIDIRGGKGGGGWGRNTYRGTAGSWQAGDFAYYSGDNGGRVVCRMDIGSLSDRTMEVCVATNGANAANTSTFTDGFSNQSEAGGADGGGTGHAGGGGGGGRSYWAYDTTDTNELVVAGGGGGGRGNGMGHNSVRENGSAGCDTYSANLETDVAAAGGGGGYYGGASACGSGTTAHASSIIMGGSGSGTNFIHDTYDVSTTQNSSYDRSSGYTGYFKMTVVSVA